MKRPRWSAMRWAVIGVGGGGEVDGTAGGVLLLKILKEFAVIGEVGDVELNGVGEVALEGGFALKEPAGEFEQSGGMMAGDGERRSRRGCRI